MNTHERKSLKRTLNVLHGMRRDIIKEAKAFNRENVGLVKHLTAVLRHIHELIGEEVPKFDKVPGVKKR